MKRPLTDDDLPLERVYRWERERADRTFLTQPYDHGKVRTWTWAEAMNEARRMAAHLQTQHWEPGTRVAILSRNCAWWVMADLAIWMAGHVSVPIYPSLRSQSVRQIIEHSEAKACFLGATDEKEMAREGIPPGVCVARFPTAGDGECPEWDDLIASVAPIPGRPKRDAGDLATIIYTSGTTGKPKGVMHRFLGFAFIAASAAELLDLTHEERVLSYLPLAHIVERGGVEATAFHLGWQLFFTEGIETFLEDLHRARPTIFLSVPRLLLKFQQGVFHKIPKEKLDRLLRIPIINRPLKRRILNQLGLKTVRNAACGAAPLPVEILRWYRNLGLNLVEGYGMSETNITHLPAPGSMRPGYVGTPFQGVEQKSENGELLIRSPMNMLGYYKEPQLTADAFTADGFFRTGDLVEIAPDGQLRIIGRVKEQFKTSKGKYVAPAPIESQLTANPAVESCCLLGAGLSAPCALVVLSPEAQERANDPKEREKIEESLRALREEVNSQVDSWERLAFIAVVDGPWSIGNGFLTPTMKVKRSILESHYQPLIEQWDREEKPVIWESSPW